MEDLEIVIIKSNHEHIEHLNDRIYFEIERNGYHNLISSTRDEILQSLTIFKGLKNKEHLLTLLNGYEYLNDSNLYFGKVLRIERYIATEYTGSPQRLKVYVDNNEVYDLPTIAEEHLEIQIEPLLNSE